MPGNVLLIGAMSDGRIAYFRGEIPTRALEVYDTKTKVRRVLEPSTYYSDYVMTSRDTVALWAGTRAPFGHGGLSFWTGSSGRVDVPGGRSLPWIFSTSEDGARVAFVTGPSSDVTLGRIVHAARAEASSRVDEVEPAVANGCRIDVRYLGARLFASSCGVVEDAATARGYDAGGRLVFTHVGVRPGIQATPRGDLAVTVGIGGGGTLVDMTTATERALPSDVVSARLAPDGAFLLTTTRNEALVRASTSDLSRTETIVPSGVKEVLAVAPDGLHAIVATDSESSGRAFEKRTKYTLALVALDAPFTVTPLVTTPAAVPRGFTESGKYVLYGVEPSATNGEIRARAVAGGQEIVLGTNVRRVSPLAGTNAFVVHARGASVSGKPLPPATVTKIDLDTPGATKLIASDVDDHVVVARTVYVGAGLAGLRALPLP